METFGEYDKATEYIFVSTSNIERVFDQAQRAFERAEKLPKVHFKNTFQGHFIGKMGETAAALWLVRHGMEVKLNYLDNCAPCDIYIPARGLRVEVKTWRSPEWNSLGHAFNSDQFTRKVKVADVVMWCTLVIPNTAELAKKNITKLYPDGSFVGIKGWNYLYEFLAIPDVERKGLMSRQIERNKIHNPHSFSDAIPYRVT